MNKSIFGDKFRIGNTLPIAAGFMLLPSFLFAQTEQQVKAIKKESNLKTLDGLQKKLKKNTLSLNELKAKAKEKNIQFSGIENGKFFQLKGFEKKTGLPIYYTTYNTDAGVGTATNKINGIGGIFNLDGEGMRIYEWDGGGILAEHREFEGRATQKDDPEAPNAHATHVAGTMIAAGIDPKARGMATKANLDAYDWNNDEIEMAAAAASGALVSNHSYGYLGGFEYGNYSGKTGWHWMGGNEDTKYKNYGKYREEDRDWDLIALSAPFYLPVKAAGNPRGGGPDSGGEHYVKVFNNATKEYNWRKSTKTREKNGGDLGFDCLNYGSVGKNILTVGAINKIPNGYTNPTEIKMASFSAFGPVDDGRIKPDIAGVGVNIYSTHSYSDGKSYSVLSGTSMASPNVTGSLLLLQEHYKNVNSGRFMKAATLKALAIGTANEAGDFDGPDYKSGWGLLNAYKAASAISTNGQYAIISENTLTNNNTEKISVTASGTEPLVVTIAWTDPIPTTLPSDALNDNTPVLVNDLDIRVKNNGQVFLPWKLEPRNPSAAATTGDNKVDNVEQITILNPVAGAVYDIEISHKGNLRKNKFIQNGSGEITGVELENANTQDYSLVVTGINNGVDKDLAIKTIAVKTAPVEYSDRTPVEIEIENRGLANIQNAKVKYELIDTDKNIIVSTNTLDTNEILAGNSVKKTIYVDLSKSFVNYKIVAQIDFAEDQIDINNKSETLAYGYVADLTQKDSSHFFGFEDELNKNGWSVEDVNGDEQTWEKYDDTKFAKDSNSLAINFPDGEDTDEWLFSNPLRLKAGANYRLIFSVRKPKNNSEKISVAFGNAPESSAMLNILGSDIEVTREYVKHLYTFTPATDGIYYIGFHNQQSSEEAPYAVFLDDVLIDQSEKALVDFSAKVKTANTITPIEFKNETLVLGSTPTYEWSFEPNSVEFVDGTTAQSENPKVVFKQEGVYTTILKAKNDKGEATTQKKDYIEVKNKPIRATFYTSRPTIYEGQFLAITNSASGDPAPTEFNWTITPSEGVEFINGTDRTTKEPVIKFNKAGKYTLTQEAKSSVDTNSYSRDEYVEVISARNPVKNAKAKVENNIVTLDWDRPNLAPTYLEDFEGELSRTKTKFPTNIKIINANKDKEKWKSSLSSNSGYYAAMSVSWNESTDDWLILPKQNKGAEVLEYSIQNQQGESYEVYIVDAPSDGSTPDNQAFLTGGHKVYTSSNDDKYKTFTTKRHNIKNYTQNDFHVAIRHNAKKEEKGMWIIVDDITLGYDNGDNTQGKRYVAHENPIINELSSYYSDYRKNEENPKIIQEEMIPIHQYLDNLEERRLQQFSTSGSGETEQRYLSQTPTLVRYEVLRDNTELSGDIEKKSDISSRYIDNTITQNGRYIYTINAVYSDGTKVPTNIEVNVGALSTSEAKDTGLKIYPNPSDGRFVVETKSNISSLKAEVYDMSGKLIFKNEFKGNKADLNLTQHPKGVYILNLVDSNGEKHSAKLMIK